jgi:hypothetical protein
MDRLMTESRFELKIYLRGSAKSSLLCTLAQILLSGASAVPPLFFRLLFNPELTPAPNPIDEVPRDLSLKHVRLLLQWKLFGEVGVGDAVSGLEEEDPPAGDFTRGAEVVPIPWVRAEVTAL